MGATSFPHVARDDGTKFGPAGEIPAGKIEGQRAMAESPWPP